MQLLMEAIQHSVVTVTIHRPGQGLKFVNVSRLLNSYIKT